MNYKHPLEIPKSKVFTGLKWLGTRVENPVKGVHGDTYPVTWADDDGVYMSSGDPNWAYFDGVPRHVPWSESIEKPDLYPHVGGVDVEKLNGCGAEFSVELINTMPGLMGPGGNGPKPSGMISVQGSLYLAVQNLLGKKPSPHRKMSQHGSDATIVRSDDYGKTWTPDIQTPLAEMEAAWYDRQAWKWKNPPEARTGWKDWKPMFPGNKFGGPTFVQYGKNNESAVDEYVYAISGDQWDNGKELRLGRVHQDKILEAAAWEWADVQQNGNVLWTGCLETSRPILTMEGHIGLPEMVYLASKQRYLLFTWGLHRDFQVELGSELTILEAPNPWGPFSLVYYEDIWESIEVCPYCPRVPMKWFDPETLQGWLLHSGNWHGTEFYKASVKPFQFLTGEKENFSR